MSRRVHPDGHFYVQTNRYVTGVGDTLVNVHQESYECHRRGCVIHAPSDHSMRSFKTHWRADRQLMERICPHGIGHPDPDHLAYLVEVFGVDRMEVESVHGCDGCCFETHFKETL